MELPNRDNLGSKEILFDNKGKIRIHLDEVVAQKLSKQCTVYVRGVHPDSIHKYLKIMRPIYYHPEEGWFTYFIEVDREDLATIISK